MFRLLEESRIVNEEKVKTKKGDDYNLFSLFVLPTTSLLLAQFYIYNYHYLYLSTYVCIV